MTLDRPVTPVSLTESTRGSQMDEAIVLAAWAVVRAAALRQRMLTLSVAVRGVVGDLDVDVDAATTGADLIAQCRSAAADLGGARHEPPADVITLLIHPGQAAEPNSPRAAGAARSPLVSLQCRPEAVDPVQATLLAGLLARAVRELTSSPLRPLVELDLLTEEERRQPSRWWRAARSTAGEPAPERHRAIRQQALRDPAQIAVICGVQRLSYGELEARANQLAHLLIGRGVGPDIPVALCLPAGVDLVVSMLAVLKAGGCYLPLDPQNPPARTAFMLDDAAVEVVVGVNGLPPEAIGSRPMIRLDTAEDQDLIAGYPETPPADPVGEHRLGYILYTSGSSGEPKGVTVPESAIGNLLRAVCRYVSLGPGDAALFSSSPVFDISTVEIFYPLMSGARVVIATRDQSRTPSEIVRLIDQHDVRFAQATPSAWRPLTDALAAGGRRERLQVVTAGEPLTGELAGRLLAAAGRVINGYGPTETTIYSTLARITSSDDVTIGEPVEGSALYLVDALDRLVPAGIPGELLIAGRGVARGYLNRPELTAKQFVRDDWYSVGSVDPVPGPRPSGLVYRTGDLAWWAPDGRLRMVGRIDDQVKVRGHRIEPGEVESRLNTHPRVSASVVRAREFGPGDIRLVAFVVTVDDRAFSLTELRDWCAQTLPEYLIPTICLTLAELPLTISGKLDERALPDAMQVRTGVAASTDRDGEIRTEPRTAAERAVARIWKAALWADELDVHDDFFDLGGDSLVANQVTLELQQEFLLDLPIRAIFEFPTVAELAAALVRARATGRFDLPATGSRAADSDGYTTPSGTRVEEGTR